MNKFAVALLVVVACALGASTAEDKVKVYKRIIPADVLRDFPGVCFAGTKCETFEVGEKWDLKPFCGRSTCVKDAKDEKKLLEMVEDCGPAPLEVPKCTIDETKTQKTAEFPKCCPVYKCDGGVDPKFPEVPQLPNPQ